jgi:hypothetical protein
MYFLILLVRFIEGVGNMSPVTGRGHILNSDVKTERALEPRLLDGIRLFLFTN